MDENIFLLSGFTVIFFVILKEGDVTDTSKGSGILNPVELIHTLWSSITICLQSVLPTYKSKCFLMHAQL